MRRDRFDVLIATSPENTWYVAGYPIRSRTYLPKRLAIAVVPAEGDTMLIVPGWEELDARDPSWIREVRSYRLFVNDPLDFLEMSFRNEVYHRVPAALKDNTFLLWILRR